MAQLIPVDHDPFAEAAPAAVKARGPLAQMIVGGPQLVPVDHDPFEEPNVAADVAKSGGIGVVKGGLGLAGATGDVRDLAVKLGEHLGLDPDRAHAVLNGLPGILGLIGKAPTSADLRGKLEDVTGPLYEPKTTAGKLAQTVGEFVPAVIGGPEALAVKLGTRVLAPAAASTAAGEMTGDNPFAKAAAAIISGVVAHKVTTPKLTPATPSVDQVKAAGRVNYRDPAIDAVAINPQAAEGVANAIAANLNRSKFNDRLAPQTHALVEDLKVPVNGGVHRIEDFDTTRQLLNTVAGKFSDPVEQAAAKQAIQLIDRYLANVPQTHLLAGDAGAANQALLTARANWASAKTAEKVADKIYNAEQYAGAAHSGGNINNATRQQLRPLLTNKTQGRGLTEAELQLIEDNVRGSTTGNVLRSAGKLLGGGGGLGMLHGSATGGAVGAALGGPPGAAIGAITAPAVGYGLKRAGDAMTRRNASALVQAILARSPEAANWRAIQARTAGFAPQAPSLPSNLAKLLALSTTDERLGPPAPYLGLRPPLGVPGQQPVP